MITRLWPYIAEGLIGGYLLKLIATGEFTIYSNPRYYWFAALAGVVLLIVGVLGAANALYSSRIKFIKGFKLEKDLKLLALLLALLVSLFTAYGLVLVIIVLVVPMPNSKVDILLKQGIWMNTLVGIAISLAFILPPTRLSPLTAHQRYSDLNTLSGDNAIKSAAQKFQIDESQYTMSDWIKTMNINTDKDYFKGKKVTVDGFLFLPDEFPLDMFMVARFKVSCCAIDATPIGIPVSYDWKAAGLASNNWVKVEGVFSTREILGIEHLVIEPTAVTVTQTPRDPYIF